MSDVKIALTREEYETLLLAVGYATGAALRDNDRKLMRAFLLLANAVNRDNPNWKPYEVPEV